MSLKKIDEQLKNVRDKVIKCKKCSLSKTRILPVIGQGDHQAKVVLIGEAPGSNEDKTGVPFCGAAGAILDELLNSINYKREDVYICNILKCRPPNNRNPETDEIKACTPYLEEQFQAINPQIICSLGNYATSYILEKYGEKEVQSIGQIHGRVFEIKTNFGLVKIIPLYHPATVVYNRNMIEILKSDFKILKKHNEK